jgi:putative ABC transport system ATP-binding protein
MRSFFGFDDLRDFKSLPNNVFAFVVVYLLRPQLLVLVLSLLSFPFLYLSLDLPKTLINEIIGGRDDSFEIFGTQQPVVQALWLMGSAYLFLILINNGFKFAINVLRLRMAAMTTRVLRDVLFRRFNGAPHTDTGGEKVPILTTEPDALGDFIGKAITVPVFQGGILLVVYAFLAVQDIAFAAVAIPFFLIQVLAVPPLQWRVNWYVRRRLLLVRHVAVGIAQIPLRSGSSLDQVGFGPFRNTFANFKMLYRLEYIGAVWAFLIQLLKGVGAQFHSWCIIVVGGYLVFKGDVSLGAVVASVAATRDMNNPFSELIDYYRSFSESQTRYEQITRRFDEPTGELFVPV